MSKRTLNQKISGTIGPTLVILAFTEYINFDIWSESMPMLTFLNGLIFLILGLLIINFHWIWKGWPILNTLTGIVMLLVGLMRMLFPDIARTEDDLLSTAIFMFMFFTGLFLSYKSFFKTI